MNFLLRSIPAVALTWTLVACGGSGSYSVDLLLGTGTNPLGQADSFRFQVVKLGKPCVLDEPDSGHNPVTVGACTYFPPPLIPLPPPDCGTPNSAASAGTIKLVDKTEGSTLGSWTSQADSASFASSPWKAGDTITVTASGADVPSFTLSAPALSAPSIMLPASLGANHDLALNWTPDPNAETMDVLLNVANRGDSISCTPPDAAGTLVIDASLLANFVSSGSIAITISRKYAATVTDGPAQVQITSFGSTETGSIAFD